MGWGPIARTAAVVAAVLLLAGCGGGDDSDTAKSISKEEFIAKGEAICKTGNKRMEAELVKFLRDGRGVESLTKPSPEDNEKFLETVLIPNLEREIAEFKELGVPEGDEERVEAIVTALEEGLETAEDNPKAVAAGTSDVVFGIASRLAAEYGLETCGSR